MPGRAWYKEWLVVLLEKFLETSMVVRMAPFSFRLALNFFKQSTVSCLDEESNYNSKLYRYKYFTATE
jgi:hypothetical protein